MPLTKQEYLTHTELNAFFASVYETKTAKNGLSPTAEYTYCTPTEGWKLEGYIDGPVIFVVMIDSDGRNFTGWSKFDYEGKYSETTGIYKAIQKMVEKYCAHQTAANLDDLLDNHWSTGSSDPFALPLTPKEESDAIQTDENPDGYNPTYKVGALR